MIVLLFSLETADTGLPWPLCLMVQFLLFLSAPPLQLSWPSVSGQARQDGKRRPGWLPWASQVPWFKSAPQEGQSPFTVLMAQGLHGQRQQNLLPQDVCQVHHWFTYPQGIKLFTADLQFSHTFKRIIRHKAMMRLKSFSKSAS